MPKSIVPPNVRAAPASSPTFALAPDRFRDFVGSFLKDFDEPRGFAPVGREAVRAGVRRLAVDRFADVPREDLDARFDAAERAGLRGMKAPFNRVEFSVSGKSTGCCAENGRR
jgi:hypothetical protein